MQSAGALRFLGSLNPKEKAALLSFSRAEKFLLARLLGGLIAARTPFLGQSLLTQFRCVLFHF